MLSLIDADGIPYIICYKYKDLKDNTNPKYIKAVEASVDDFISNLLNKVSTKEYIGFLGNGEKTFRHEAAKHRKYKGTRNYSEVDNGYTVWKDVILNRLITKWQFRFVPVGTGLETDDAISIAANELLKTRASDTIVVCSADKDLLQIPCKHFSFINWERGIIQSDVLGDIFETKEGKDKKYSGFGFKFLMYQMIIGDQVDNIMGIKGKGPAYAYKVLKDCNTKLSCVKAVLRAYIDWVDSYYGKVLFREMYTLLKLLEENTFGINLETIKYK